MILNHHKKTVELDDPWWEEVGMQGFRSLSRAYKVDSAAFPDREVFEVLIEDVGHVQRSPGIGIFNNNEISSARERVTSILRGFREGTAIPPVEVVMGGYGYPYPYKLVHGAHRFYCSIAAGFTHVPALLGFDISALNDV